MGIRSELKLIERAARWNVSDSNKSEIVEKVVGLITDADAKPRTVIAAARVVAAMEAQNQKDEHIKLQSDGNRFLAMLEYIRINGSIEGFEPQGAIGVDGGADPAPDV